MLKLLLQEGNLSNAGCFGTSHSTAEIIEADSARNYSRRTLDAGRRPLILLLAPPLPHVKIPTVLRATALGKNVRHRPNHTSEVIDAITNVIRLL